MRSSARLSVSLLLPLPLPLLLAALSSGIAGCDDSDSPPDDMTPGIPITISTVMPPGLVAYRDGLDGPWKAATMKTATTFEAAVHGPYVVTIVCQDPARGLFSTFQLARTLDDEHAVSQTCDYTPPTRFPVTGHMVQAGRVQIEDALKVSATAGWDFNLGALAGTRDLMALAADRIVLRHALPITGATAITPEIDIAQEGTLLADVAFTATNAAPTETLAASVNIDKPTTPLAVFRGPSAAAKVAPDSVLVPTDAQSVSIQATAGTAVRSLRRPFRVGGNTQYTLPAPVTGLQWTIAGGNLSASWSTIPELTAFTMDASGASDPSKFQNHYIDLSPRFVADTGGMSATIDTEIPGYKPEWRVDFARPYFRRVFLQRIAGGEISTTVVSEQITPLTALASPSPSPAPDRPLPHARLAIP